MRRAAGKHSMRVERRLAAWDDPTSPASLRIPGKFIHAIPLTYYVPIESELGLSSFAWPHFRDANGIRLCGDRLFREMMLSARVIRPPAYSQAEPAGRFHAGPSR